MTMRMRMAVLAVLILGHPGASAASLFSEAAERLNGEWRGGEFVLRVDAKRAQASTANDRPFEWQRFVVREVVGNEVVFAIGTELFEAVIESDTIVLTSSEFRGERVLFRGADGSGAKEPDDMGLRGTAE
jgi:ribose 1,5-bisphosphokinase PhnN